ncbi:MAG TPA: hypothetical protein PK295_02290 [Candidatus Magasanikbacteria bacterium]|nr:hypothetical protein [Candidatus Magasanikbacteria bacterium]
MDKKRILIIIGFLGICVLLGFAIYWVFFRKAPGTTIPTQSGTQTNSGLFPETGERDNTPISSGQGTLPIGTGQTNNGQTTGGITGSNTINRPNSESLITKTVDVSIGSPSPGPSGNARFYNETDGKFYTLDRNGNVRVLSDTVFYNVTKATWSPESNESIIEYPDGSNIYYNFETNEQVTLPKHWESFSFSKEGSRITAKSMGLSPDNRWLITSDPTGSNVSLVEPLGDNASKVMVDWSPNRQVVALSLTGDEIGGQRQEVLLVGQNHENFKSIEVEGRGLQAQWSPQGNKLLHSVHSSRTDYKPELWIVDASPDNAGANRKPLGVNTWASKCTMADERTVYCGVPTTLESGAGFAPEVANFTPDAFYRIDTVTGIRTELKADNAHVVDSMFVSGDGSVLYFTDKNQDGLFSIPLK